MKDSQQESHTEVKPKEVTEIMDHFYNERGDYTITLNDKPIAFTPDKVAAHKLCTTFNIMKATIKKQAETNSALYGKLQKIKALTQDIR